MRRILSVLGFLALPLAGCAASAPPEPASVGPTAPMPRVAFAPSVRLRFADDREIVLRMGVAAERGDDRICRAGSILGGQLQLAPWCGIVAHDVLVGLIDAYDPSTLARLWTTTLPPWISSSPRGTAGKAIVFRRSIGTSDACALVDRDTGAVVEATCEEAR